MHNRTTCAARGCRCRDVFRFAPCLYCGFGKQMIHNRDGQMVTWWCFGCNATFELIERDPG